MDLSDIKRIDADEPGGSEAILVVEDDENVRTIVVEMLSDLGYRIMVARDGKEALEVLSSDAPIDLLFTDQIMPNGISGLELAHHAGRLKPGIKVLLCSGYARAVKGDGGGDEVFPVIAKPYRSADLAQKVRTILGQTPTPRPEDRLSA